MKKLISLFLAGFVVANAYASIPYCPGTDVKGSKHDALQYVITTFANQNNCFIGSNCILNFDGVKYSIAWAQDCVASKNKGNDPKGSTFICTNGKCTPFGFSEPHANY